MHSIEFRIDPCSYKAALYAATHWHYSKRLPLGKMFRLGVWEEGIFKGSIIYSRGACPQMGCMFGLRQGEIVELTRIALREHKTCVSKMISVSLKILRKICPGIKLVVSYADPDEGHHGGIYQAAGWIYFGKSTKKNQYFYKGKWTHNRTFKGVFGSKPIPFKQLPKRISSGKHRYCIALDKKLEPVAKKLAKPYPKKQVASALVEGT